MRLRIRTLFMKAALIALAGLGWLAHRKGWLVLLLEHWLWAEASVWMILIVLTAWRRWSDFLPRICLRVIPMGARLPGLGLATHLPEILQALFVVLYVQRQLMVRGR